jgi:transposase-like protein
MSGRISYAVWYAIKAVQEGSTLTAAAQQYGCNLRSLRRAIRRAEKAPAPAANDAQGDAGGAAPPETAGTQGQGPILPQTPA